MSDNNERLDSRNLEEILRPGDCIIRPGEPLEKWTRLPGDKPNFIKFLVAKIQEQPNRPLAKEEEIVYIKASANG